MEYNLKLAERIRQQLTEQTDVVEKEMMGGLTFMVNGKMCVGIIDDELMCRINPALHESSVERTGCRTMDFTKRPMKGYVMVDETGMGTGKQLKYWMDLALEFNKIAKAAKKRKK